ncbi:MAG: ABC transporter substrate-binding protein [Alkalispirochaetaceae bacterium]
MLLRPAGIILLLLSITPILIPMGARSSEEAEPVRIALGVPLSGDWADKGEQIQRGAELAVTELNNAGGILGRPVELLVGDTEGHPKKATVLARTWSEDPTVIAEVGGFASTPAIAAQRIYHAAGLLQVSPAVGHPAFAAGSPWSFSMIGLNEGEGESNARYAFDELGSRRAAIIFSDSEWGRRASTEFAQTFSSLGGDVVAQAFYFSGELLQGRLLERILGSNPDLLYMVAKDAEGAQIGRILDDADAEWDGVRILAPSRLHSESFLSLAGERAEGIITSAHFLPQKAGSSAEGFYNAYRRRYEQAPQLVAALAYDAVHSVALAAEHAGSVDREELRVALSSLAPFEGATGEVHFSEDGNARRRYVHLEVDGGEFTLR